tara:strand:- start:53 stop:1399 length:1347 start_codon:yes stop_codon:yes gene_type:complete
MENKNIDKFFQEKLKNLEATPTKRVWNNIETNLKKKKRRVLPIWWFSSGIAALLILGFLLSPSSNNTINTINKSPIIIANPSFKTQDSNSKKTDSVFNAIKKEIIIVEENKASKKKHIINKKQRETRFLLAEKPKKKIQDSKISKIENSVNKNILLSEKTIKENLNIKKKKIRIAKENVLSKTEKTSNLVETNKLKNSKKEVLIAINKDKKEETLRNKKTWTVSPVVAVINSNSFSNSSPINKNLGNSTRGNNSYSYGIQVGYELNKKWTIQSGIHLQEIIYSNNQIAINPTKTSISNVVFNSGENYALQDISSEGFDSSSLSLNSISLDGNLTQSYGYIEIPVEIKYNVLEHRNLKTELVAGFSSLFLNKNSVDLESSFFSQSGKANNLNNLNFSGNLGVDFNYKFDKNWSLNFNPMFKTQLNTFNKNTNGFKPYFIGIYTGVNYKF